MYKEELRVCELRVRHMLGVSTCIEPKECLTLRNGKPCGWFKERHEIVIRPRQTH